MKTFADLHCHPVSWNFNRMRNSDNEQSEIFNPWHPADSDLEEKKKGKRAYNFTQGDFAKLLVSGTRLAFASIYPFEKGFFDETLIGEKQRKSDQTTLLDKIQAKQMGFAIERVNFMQSAEYDYYEEMLREYEFYKKRRRARKCC